MNEISLNMENGFIDLNEDNTLLTDEQINIIKNKNNIKYDIANYNSNLPNTIQPEFNNNSIIKKMVYTFSCLGGFTIALIIVMTTI